MMIAVPAHVEDQKIGKRVGGIPTVLGSERRRMDYPDDPGPAPPAVDDRGSNRLSGEVEAGGFLIDDADTALAGHWMVKPLACQQR